MAAFRRQCFQITFHSGRALDAGPASRTRCPALPAWRSGSDALEPPPLNQPRVMAGIIMWVMPPLPEGGEPAEEDGEHPHEHDAEPEAGQRLPKEGDYLPSVVKGRVLLGSHKHTDGYTEGGANRQGEGRQLHGGGEFFQHYLKGAAAPTSRTRPSRLAARFWHR